MSCTLISWLLPNCGPLNGDCREISKHKCSFFYGEEIRLPCGTSTAGISFLQNGGLLRSKPFLTQNDPDRRDPCCVRTFFTCNNIAHLCRVSTHQGNLPVWKKTLIYHEEKQPHIYLRQTAGVCFPSLPLPPATIPSLAILAPLPLCQMVKLFKLDRFLTRAAHNGGGDFKVGFREAKAKTECSVF